MNKMSWKDQALCKNDSLNLFFSPPKSPESNAALKICKECPVRDHCLLEGFQYNYDGIWGGSTFDQRNVIARMFLDNYVGQITLEQAQDLLEIVDSIGTTKAAAMADAMNMQSEEHYKTIDTE